MNATTSASAPPTDPLPDTTSASNSTGSFSSASSAEMASSNDNSEAIQNVDVKRVWSTYHKQQKDHTNTAPAGEAHAPSSHAHHHYPPYPPHSAPYPPHHSTSSASWNNHGHAYYPPPHHHHGYGPPPPHHHSHSAYPAHPPYPQTHNSHHSDYHHHKRTHQHLNASDIDVKHDREKTKKKPKKQLCVDHRGRILYKVPTEADLWRTQKVMDRRSPKVDNKNMQAIVEKQEQNEIEKQINAEKEETQEETIDDSAAQTQKEEENGASTEIAPDKAATNPSIHGRPLEKNPRRMNKSITNLTLPSQPEVQNPEKDPQTVEPSERPRRSTRKPAASEPITARATTTRSMSRASIVSVESMPGNEDDETEGQSCDKIAVPANNKNVPHPPSRVLRQRSASADNVAPMSEQDRVLKKTLNSVKAKLPAALAASSSRQQGQNSYKSWTPQEDEHLLHLKQELGLSWPEIAARIPGRTNKQVRARYENTLDPTLSREPFTEQERLAVLELQKKLGNKWKQIADLLPGRSENMVKNCFYSAERMAVRRAQQFQTQRNRQTLQCNILLGSRNIRGVSAEATVGEGKPIASIQTTNETGATRQNNKPPAAATQAVVVPKVPPAAVTKNTGKGRKRSQESALLSKKKRAEAPKPKRARFEEQPKEKTNKNQDRPFHFGVLPLCRKTAKRSIPTANKSTSNAERKALSRRRTATRSLPKAAASVLSNTDGEAESDDVFAGLVQESDNKENNPPRPSPKNVHRAPEENEGGVAWPKKSTNPVHLLHEQLQAMSDEDDDEEAERNESTKSAAIPMSNGSFVF